MLRTHGATFHLAVMPDAGNDMVSWSVIGKQFPEDFTWLQDPGDGGWHPGMHGPRFELAIAPVDSG